MLGTGFIKMYFWASHKQLFYPFIPILLLMDISAIFLNGLVAYVLKRHKKTSIITFWFIYCLSISDVMVGVSCLVYHLLLLRLSLDSKTSLLEILIKVAYRCLEFFFAMSGHIIFIIAVDRSIHMKYLNKYSRLMTRSRSQFIMLCNVIFGLLFMIPPLAASEKFNVFFDLGLNVFHAVGALLIYVVYIKTYFSMRRKLAALQFGKGSNTAPHYKSNKTLRCQLPQSGAQHCSRSAKAQLGMIIDPKTAPNTSLSCTLAKEASVLESHNKAVFLPNSSVPDPATSIDNKETSADITRMSHSSFIVENDIISRATDRSAACRILMENVKGTKTQLSPAESNQKPQKRMSAAEQQFRKAILFILFALFISYLPFFFYEIYFYANKSINIVFSFISFISLQLNSSMNALILIAFNKDMQKNIKRIFVKE